jgi:hypothetical protein
MGLGGGRRRDPLFIVLRSLLPDVEDAIHVVQVEKNGIGFLITTDHPTLIRFLVEIERLCDITVLSPADFAQRMA